MQAAVKQRLFLIRFEQARGVEQNHGDQTAVACGAGDDAVELLDLFADEIVGFAVVLVGNIVFGRLRGHDGGQIDITGRLVQAEVSDILVGAVERFDAGRLRIGRGIFRNIL